MARPRAWTDEDLRTAVEASSTIAEVVRRLRLSHGGAAYITVRTRIEQLGLDTCHFGRYFGRTDAVPAEAPPPERRPSLRSWTDEDLAAAVAASTSLNGTFSRLGLRVGGSQWLVVRARIRDLGLATDHWTRPLDAAARTATAELRRRLQATDLRPLIPTCRSRAELLRRLGVAPTAATYRALRAAFEAQGIDGDELDGRGRGGSRPRPLDELLVEGRAISNTAALKGRLITEGILRGVCAVCGIEDWCGRPAPLHLDHINGDRRDNRRENLRLVCPNCHAQTDTYCGRNVGRYDVDG